MDSSLDNSAFDEVILQSKKQFIMRDADLKKAHQDNTFKEFLGIDPGGSSGAWAIIDGNEFIVAAGTFSNVAFLKGYKVIKACIEQVHAMPGQGVTSMFSFGQNYGTWLGALEALGIPYIMCTPGKWQKEIMDVHPTKEGRSPKESLQEERARLTRNRTMLKGAVVEFAKRYFKGADEYLKLKKNYGIADALCMALFAKRTYLMGVSDE
jgi:hypothetical protein